jgi:3-hydroxybutyryl-CoA dehydrogenase
MEIKQVGVIGCGTMGAGIVQICVQSGYNVIVSEVNENLLTRGLSSISGVFDRSIAKNITTSAEKGIWLSRIKGTTNMNDLNNCDIVIEAAIEDINIKKKIFGELDKICPQRCILATNTSCLSVIDIAMATSRPDKVVGLHFFNPVPLMKLLELVRSIVVSEDTLTAASQFGKSLGKEVILTQDTPGFIVNRLLIPFILNAIRMLENRVATRDEIDTAMKLGANLPMGPLALADLIGVDVIAFIASEIYEVIKDSQFTTPVLVQKMIAAHQLGRKTKIGFYTYT